MGLLLEDFDRMFVHGHRIRCIDHGNAFASIAKLFELSLDLGLRSAQNHMQVFVLVDGVNRTFNHYVRGEIATESIKSNFYHGHLLTTVEPLIRLRHPSC